MVSYVALKIAMPSAKKLIYLQFTKAIVEFVSFLEYLPRILLRLVRFSRKQ